MTELRPIVALALRGYFMPRSGIHGPGHWLRVLRNGREIAARTADADLSVIEVFALLHDCRRRNDGADPQHGQRAADMVNRLGRAGQLPLDAGQVTLLAKACARHELGEVSTNATIGTCWDADRLELSRLSRRPVAHLLSTRAARDPDVQVGAWQRGIKQIVDPDDASAVGLELAA